MTTTPTPPTGDRPDRRDAPPGGRPSDDRPIVDRPTAVPPSGDHRRPTGDSAERNLARRAALESGSDALQGDNAPPAPHDDAVGSAAAERKKIRAERRKLLLTSPAFVAGSLILGFWILCAIVPDVFATWGPTEVVRLDDGTTIPRTPPSSDAWFGTDSIGNDVYSRVIHGARPVLILAPIAALLSVIAGTMLGLVMGYLRGWTDEILSRVIEAFLSIPVILLALMVLVIFGRSRLVIILTIAVLFTPIVTRTVRSTVMGEAQLDYVTSAKLRGESNLFIMTREILPNITSVIVVEFTVRVGYAVFTVATLAFLGLTSDDATAADWGRDVANSYGLIQSDQWWPALFPALAIASLVIAVNLIADSLDRVSKA